jgi:hypothetical protein
MSGSDSLRGYKLYWSKNETLDYNSPSVFLGNVSQVVLPDALGAETIYSTPLRFGLTALDHNENESDIRIIGTFRLFDPIDIQVPATPEIPEPCFPDPTLRLLLVQLNSSAREAHCYEKAKGLSPLGRPAKELTRRTIRETRTALMQLTRQLDRVLPHN